MSRKTAADGGAPVFVPAPSLADEGVQQIVETAAKRIVRLLQRRGLATEFIYSPLPLLHGIRVGIADAGSLLYMYVRLCSNLNI